MLAAAAVVFSSQPVLALKATVPTEFQFLKKIAFLTFSTSPCFADFWLLWMYLPSAQRQARAMAILVQVPASLVDEGEGD